MSEGRIAFGNTAPSPIFTEDREHMAGHAAHDADLARPFDFFRST